MSYERNAVVNRKNSLIEEEVIFNQITAKISHIKKGISEINQIDALVYISNKYYLDDNGFINQDCLLVVQYLQKLIVSIKEDLSVKRIDVDISEFDKIYLEALEIIGLQRKYLYIRDRKKEDNSNIFEYIQTSSGSKDILGKRFPFLQITYFDILLRPHQNVFWELFEISYDNFISGLEKLEYKMSIGRLDNYPKSFSYETDERILVQKDNLIKTVDVEYYNVESITGWPRKLLKSLSLEIGEDDCFSSESKFSGWPISFSKTYYKPFITYEENIYCFQYHVLFDNLYRSLYRAIKELEPSYDQRWQIVQKEATESTVKKLLGELLRGATIHDENYFYVNNRKDSRVENDIIIEFHNTLIICEVKSGSFTPTSSFLDVESHQRSFKELIAKGQDQCETTLEYLRNNTKIYDKNGVEKAVIDIEKFERTVCLIVTLDDFNFMSSRINRYNLMDRKISSLVFTLDDLLVFKTVFPNSLLFSHYLIVRERFLKNSNIVYTDEVDILNLFFEFNDFESKLMEQLHDLDSYTYIYAGDYSETIENFFAHKRLGNIREDYIWHEHFTRNFRVLLNELDRNGDYDSYKLGISLLSLSSNELFEFMNSLDQGISYLKDKRLSVPISFLNPDVAIVFCLVNRFDKQAIMKNFNFSKALSQELNRETVYSMCIAYNREKINNIKVRIIKLSSILDSGDKEIERIRLLIRRKIEETS